VGLSLYTIRPHDGPEILPMPEPIDFGRDRGPGTSAPLKVSQPFFLNFYTSESHPLYRIEIIASDGHPLYSLETTLSEGLISLKKSDLPPGVYKIQLYGLTDGKSERIGKPRMFIVQP